MPLQLGNAKLLAKQIEHQSKSLTKLLSDLDEEIVKTAKYLTPKQKLEYYTTLTDQRHKRLQGMITLRSNMK